MRVVRNISLTAVDTGAGTAAEDQILAGEIAYSQGAELTGTMPNNAGDVAAASYHNDGTSLHVVPQEGYVDGVDDAVVITDAQFLAANIAHDIEIFGLTGTYDTEAVSPITVNDVLLDKIGFVNGAQIVGTMPNNAGDNASLSNSTTGTTVKLVAPEGYYDGSDDTVTVTDANLIAENIKSGVTILGVLGTYTGA